MNPTTIPKDYYTYLKGELCTILKMRAWNSYDLLDFCKGFNHPDLYDMVKWIVGLIPQSQPIAAVNGNVFFLPDDKIITPHMRTGSYEGYESWVIRNYLRKGDVAFDVGACIGYYASLFSYSVGHNGKVVAFEPNRSNHLLAQANIRINCGLETSLRCEAVGDVEGKQTLHKCGFNAGDHRLSKEAPFEGKRETEEVYCTKLDEYHGPINLLKVDVQGYEIRVLRGARRQLDSPHSMAMALEYWPWGMDRAGDNKKEFADLVYDAGFRVHVVDNDTFKIHPVYTKEHLLNIFDPVKKPMHFVNLWCVR